MHAFASLLRNRRAFRRLWLAEVVSQLGDWLSFVAVSTLALHEGQGAMDLALVFVAHCFPNAAFAPLAGVLADRFDRRRLLLGANLVEATLTVAMTIAAASRNLLAVQILLLARASVSALREPAASAALRRIVDERELVPASSLLALTWSILFTVGMGLGGVLAIFGTTTALLLDAASFAGAALLLSALPPLPVEGRTGKEGIGEALRSIGSDTVAAVRFARARPELLEAVLSKTPLALAGGAAWVALNRVAGEHAFLGASALTLGVLQSVRGLGTGLGPLAASAWMRRGASLAKASRLSDAVAFVGIAFFAASGHWLPLLATVFVWGLGTGSNWVLSTTEILRQATDRFAGRLSALDVLMFTSGQCVTAIAGAALVDSTGVTASSAWLGLAAGIPAALLVRSLSVTRGRGPGQAATPLPAVAESPLE